MNTTTAQTIGGIAILITVLVGLFVLVWHGAISGTDALGVIGTITAVAVGALAHNAGTAAGAKAAATTPPTPPVP